MGQGREAEREDQAGSGLREQKSDDQEGSAGVIMNEPRLQTPGT